MTIFDIRRYIRSATVLGLGAAPTIAFAQGDDFTFQRVVNIAYGLVQFLFTASFGLATILGLWFGIQYMTAGSNAERLTGAKRGLMWTIIGFAVVMAANVIVLSLRRAITGG